MANTTIPGAVPGPWVPDHHLRCRLYHGCLRQDATVMLRGGGSISFSAGRPDADFGPGFYTTTLRRQAESWAYLKYAALPFAQRGNVNHHPVVLWLDVPRSSLSQLESLAFVRSDFAAEDYWSFVHHCRARPAGGVRGHMPGHAPGHVRDTSGRLTWYDLVGGAVSAFWPQRIAVPDGDQFSFHTQAAVDVLNDIIMSGTSGGEFGVDAVPF